MCVLLAHINLIYSMCTCVSLADTGCRADQCFAWFVRQIVSRLAWLSCSAGTPSPQGLVRIPLLGPHHPSSWFIKPTYRPQCPLPSYHAKLQAHTTLIYSQTCCQIELTLKSINQSTPPLYMSWVGHLPDSRHEIISCLMTDTWKTCTICNNQLSIL